jgi:Cdc6-like AAA superfamily ATPase
MNAGSVGQRDSTWETKLYGRSHEVKILQDAFQRMLRGNSEVILVRGLPGIGKTKLVKEALRQCLTGNDRGRSL